MMATKLKKVHFNIPQELWEAFAESCENNGTFPSQALREFCKSYTSNKPSIKARKRRNKTNKKTKMLNKSDSVVQKVGELYSGPGGIGLGAAKARIRKNSKLWITEPTWINDFCEDSCKTWANNVLTYETRYKDFSGDVQIHSGDVRNLDIDSLPEIDGLMFGFPCNDFSQVGEKKGFDGEYGPLYSYGIKILNKKKKPSWFIAENVGGITSSNEGLAFNQILLEMQDAGYQITAHKYKLEEYGIPQARHRVIIVGFRKDLDLSFRVPAPLPAHKRKTAGDALSKKIPNWVTNNELTKQSATVVERLSFIDPGENCWDAKRLPDHLKLNVPNTKLSHIYKKIDPTKPSYTVTGSGGGGTHMYHWAENRALTNRERARLQTFPDDFNFYGSKESVRKQIGMAIPVDAAKQIVEAVLKTIAGVKYKSIEANIIPPLL